MATKAKKGSARKKAARSMKRRSASSKTRKSTMRAGARKGAARKSAARKSAGATSRKSAVNRVKRVTREVVQQASVAMAAGVETLRDLGENLVDRVRA
jgi:hypothetical protein